MYPFGKQEGIAAVEFIIILPLLLILMIGLIDFGHLFWHKHVLTNAAREGARAAVQREDAESAVVNYIDNEGLNISVSVNVLYDGAAYDPENPPVLGSEVKVTVTESPYQFPIPPWGFGNIDQLLAAAVMRHQG